MGVDYYVCRFCDEIENDCGEYGSCCLCSEFCCTQCNINERKGSRRREGEGKNCESCCITDERDKDAECENHGKKDLDICCINSGCIICPECEKKRHRKKNAVKIKERKKQSNEIFRELKPKYEELRNKYSEYKQKSFNDWIKPDKDFISDSD